MLRRRRSPRHAIEAKRQQRRLSTPLVLVLLLFVMLSTSISMLRAEHRVLLRGTQHDPARRRIKTVVDFDAAFVQDALHLAALNAACRRYHDSVIPWRLGVDSADSAGALLNRSDPNLLAQLRQCPDVDVFVPAGIRNHGYCEDASAYTKYLESRMLPRWVFEIDMFDAKRNASVRYHELCPNTPVVVLNHYLDDIHKSDDWPRAKQLYVMPNIEMYEVDATLLWSADVILCKTIVCEQRVNAWYRQVGNPKNTRVLYTRHTSSNVALISQLSNPKNDSLALKDFETPVFVHTAGSSIQKGTSKVLDCWLSRPDFPPLHVYMQPKLFELRLQEPFGLRIQQSPNVHLHTERLDESAFGRLLAQSAFFLCTSVMEGYGHYINQARAAAGLIVTPDVDPMNELITPSSGVLVAARREAHPEQFLGGESQSALGLRDVEGFVANFWGSQVCEAIENKTRMLADNAIRPRAAPAQQQQQQQSPSASASASDPSATSTRATMPPSTSSAMSSRQGLLAMGAAIVLMTLWSVGTEFSVTTLMEPSAPVANEWDVASESDRVNLYPEELFATDWSAKVPDSEIMHLSVLHRTCMTHRESVIPWNFGIDGHEELLINQTDPNLMARLRQCPDVDVFIPAGLRGHGYCEDALAYTKYLKSRMITTWVLEAKFVDEKTQKELTYHDLCPDTPVIVFNHYWENIRDDPNWPKRKKIFMMPNIEMYELSHREYWGVDVILCKTAICTRYLNKWMKQEGNPNNTKVFFTRHTSSDVTALTRVPLRQSSLETKNYKDPKFVHTVGGSIQKGTGKLLDCWLSRPDFPPLYIYIGTNLYNSAFKKHYDKAITKSKNIHLHADHLDGPSFSKLYTDSSFFVCSSHMEGYGHYINQARAAGAFVITPDVPPMNELITPSSGQLMTARRSTAREQFLGGNSDKAFALRDVPGYIASFSGNDVCGAVDEVLKLSPEERQLRAERARQQYFFDIVFFAERMEELREYARGKKNLLRRPGAGLQRRHN
ncbi:hypothetical protein P43SY_011332 [Pythium insidiosum]|uniref:Glycosyl transferase family 1 domain-containing protein n=1 Tax=Pythium insidiosum TaxID=114742 RepID=A0AAD5Q1T3_PYTIN|nr:hypothetical protein P43SY_011332 [Pythium insidiosum]